MVTTTRPCGDTRPEDRKDEKTVEEQKYTVGNLDPNFHVILALFPGCVQGGRVAVATRGDDRHVLLDGTAQQIVEYGVGKQVTIEGVKYSRNVSARAQPAVDGIIAEMTGTGEVAKLIEETGKKTGKGAQFGGYTVTVHAKAADGTEVKERVTLGSKVNQYFRPDSVLKDDVKREFLGGVELMVSAIIIPGSSNDKNVLGTESTSSYCAKGTIDYKLA
ncbi:hypothetical protein COV17_03635 [Candidatus Woesearchaeota archaeon CG10_big_fil_rev_8_21_14_0_10_36_11]|nr:MAG: hypothetical protein COV17_03635 [Candidatus Woesearchaeota archaeon CG10_big_fil_rev_8_21_14_0_10_36_11]